MLFQTHILLLYLWNIDCFRKFCKVIVCLLKTTYFRLIMDKTTADLLFSIITYKLSKYYKSYNFRWQMPSFPLLTLITC